MEIYFGRLILAILFSCRLLCYLVFSLNAISVNCKLLDVCLINCILCKFKTIYALWVSVVRLNDDNILGLNSLLLQAL